MTNNKKEIIKNKNNSLLDCIQKKFNHSMTVSHAETDYILTDNIIVVAEGSQNAGPPPGCVHQKGRPSVCHSC